MSLFGRLREFTRRWRDVWRCPNCRATFPFEDPRLYCPYCERMRLTLVKQRVR